ncbi:glyoxylate reductase/hydroxypyruvate reductase [Anoplophora glabripennis]|nr:glyoxylate reductase/hydroxypyruvate reductase [Anoplophora glabripennis]
MNLNSISCAIRILNLNHKIIPSTLNIFRFCRNNFTSIMNKPSVYITRQVNEEALDILREHCEITSWTGEGPVPRDELLRKIEDKNALFCMLTDQINSEVLNKAGKKLQIVATMSVGYDHLDVDEIKKRKIKMAYTPDILTDATAELTVALLLATSRRILEANEAAKNGEWKAWSPFWLCGTGLQNSTVGIVGFGRIGQEIAKRLKSFKPKNIVYYNRSEKADEAKLVDAKRVTFDKLLAKSDFVIVSCSLTQDTQHLFNENAFNKMKRTAIFVNTSRGGVVDQDALIKALENKIILGAGLDVMTPEPLPLHNPLFKLKNCVILPHIGSACIQTRKEMAILCAKNIIAALRGEELPSELII